MAYANNNDAEQFNHLEQKPFFVQTDRTDGQLDSGNTICPYQLPFILTALLHDHCCLSHGMCLYQVMMTLHFLNDITNDAKSIQKIDHYVIFASLKSESTW